MNRKLLSVVLLVVLLMLITGCWNRREMNELSILVGSGIDKADQGYKLTMQIMNSSEITQKASGSMSYSPVTTISVTCSAIFECLRKATLEGPRKIYNSHNRILVISEELAEEGISKIMDIFIREHEFRSDVYVVIAKDVEASEILSVLTKEEKVPANYLHSSLSITEEVWASTTVTEVDKVITTLLSEDKNLTLTGITAIGSKTIGKSNENVLNIQESRKLKYTPIAVFKKDKLIGWLNEEESIGYNYILGKVVSALILVSGEDDEKIIAEVIRTEGKIKGKIERGKPKVDVDIIVEANVGEVEGSQWDLSDLKTIEKLEKEFAKSIEKSVNLVIEQAQKKFQSDIFGFGGAIRRKDRKVWKEIKKDWDQTFPDLLVQVKVDVKLRRVGKVIDSYNYEMKNK